MGEQVSKQDIEQIVGDAVEQFAGMVKSGFDEVNQRFDRVDAGLDGHDRRFDRLEKDMAEVKYLLTDVVRRDEFLDVKKRIGIPRVPREPVTPAMRLGEAEHFGDRWFGI